MNRDVFVEFLMRAKESNTRRKAVWNGFRAGKKSASAGKKSTSFIFTAAEWNDFADRNAEIR